MGIISFRESVQKSFSKTPIHFQWGWILTVIGLLFLRFWRINERDWGYDELSAILRALGATTWQQHLHQGVIIDGHPAGLQTILWIWVQAFGSNVLPLRLLTAGIGLFTLFQSHQLAKRLFGFETAYWTVVMMGLMWWQVSMGIWIRPYVWALPFVLWAWDLVFRALNDANRMANGNEIINPNNAATSMLQDITEISPAGRMNKPTSMGWFSLQLGGALAGAAYFHYCAGLAAGAAFIALLLIQPKIQTNPSNHTQGLHPSYILFLPLTFAFLFYLPHLLLTFAQFQLGGLGWLNRPTPQFLWQFLKFATGNSLPILWLFITTLIYAIQYHIRIAYLPKPASFKRILQQSTLLLTLGFLMVFAFGYIYSVVRAPILQNNALYFAFPLLILVAASGITTLRNQLGDTQNGINAFEKFTQPLAILFPALLLFNTLYQKQFLTLERKVTHHRIVEQSLQFADNQTQSHQARGTNSNLYIWLDGPTDNYQFHRSQILHKHKSSNTTPTDYFESHGPTLTFIAEQMRSLQPNAQLFLGLQSGSQPWLLPLIESHFNYTSRYQQPNTSTPSKSNLAHEFLIGGEWLTLAEPRVPQFTPKDFHLLNADFIQNTADSTLFSTTIILNELAPSPNDVILIVVKVTDAKGEIQTSLWNPNKPEKDYYPDKIFENTHQIDWRSTKIADYQQAGFKYALHAIKLADIPGWETNTELRIQITAANQCLIGLYKGNPNLYGVQP